MYRCHRCEGVFECLPSFSVCPICIAPIDKPASTRRRRAFTRFVDEAVVELKIAPNDQIERTISVVKTLMHVAQPIITNPADVALMEFFQQRLDDIIAWHHLLESLPNAN